MQPTQPVKQMEPKQDTELKQGGTSYYGSYPESYSELDAELELESATEPGIAAAGDAQDQNQKTTPQVRKPEQRYEQNTAPVAKKAGRSAKPKLTRRSTCALLVMTLTGGLMFGFFNFNFNSDSNSMGVWDKLKSIVESTISKAPKLIAPAKDFENLFEAAAKGSASDVKAFIQNRNQNGADMNMKDKNGFTPMMFAAGNNHDPEVIKVLYQNGADLETKSNNGMTPIMFAAQHNNAEVVKALAKLGVRIQAERYGDGMTAIMLAARYNPSGDVIEALLDAGAALNSTDKNGWSPLMYAAMYNNSPEVIKALRNHNADFTAKNYDGLTALALAAGWNSNQEIVETLIDSGYNIVEQSIAQDQNGWTPLMYAVRFNSSEKVVKTILKKDKASALTRDADGATPLMWAARNETDGAIAIIEALLDEFLLSFRADVHDADSAGRTPLMYAAGWNTSPQAVKIIDTLVKHRADPSVKSNNGWTALDFAYNGDNKNNLEVTDALKQAERASVRRF